MSTNSFSTMPEAFDFTSTLVIGWIFPVATTERATSPRVTLAILLGSMEEPEAIRATATPAPTRTKTTTPTISHIQKRLLLFDAATEHLPWLQWRASPEERSKRLTKSKPTGQTAATTSRQPNYATGALPLLTSAVYPYASPSALVPHSG